MQQGTTLDQFLEQHMANSSTDTDDLRDLLAHIATACIELTDLVSRGELAGVLGAAGQENVQGEEQKKLDIIANDVFIELTQDTGRVAGLAS